MNRIACLVLGFSLLLGCELPLPNGVFKCNGDPDCPGGFSCALDELCYDEGCEQQSWEEVRRGIFDTYAILGHEPPTIECGDFTDQCGRTVQGPHCLSGDSCSDFMCGCLENSCEGLECGSVERSCSSGGPIDCGTCLGAQECDDGQCVCPAGMSCDAGCPGGCASGEICVQGICCTQQFPCRDNSCSPPGGFSDGCGGIVHCEPRCNEALGLSCAQAQAGAPYTCVSCCQQQGKECDTCNGVLCGTCAANEACTAGKCVQVADVCGDVDEPNDSESTATDVCNGTCSSKLWTVTLDRGSLRDAQDEDYFVVKVPDSRYYSLHMEVSGLDSNHELRMKYLCANGGDGRDDCSGSSSNEYCIEDGKEELVLYRNCGGSGTGTLYAIVGSKDGEYRGPCDDYKLTLWTEYFEYDD